MQKKSAQGIFPVLIIYTHLSIYFISLPHSLKKILALILIKTVPSPGHFARQG